MSWQDRLYSEIKLTSPRGIVFNAFWRGGPRDAEKSLGIFNLPGVRGSIVQDLERGAVTYTLTLSFYGPDHDVTADQFFKECGNTTGIWTIVHPVRGRLKLQLMSYSEAIEPVSSGNITTFSTEWIQPLIPSKTQVSALVKSNVISQEAQVEISASNQLANNANQETFEKQLKIKSETLKMLGFYDIHLKPLINKTGEVKSLVDSIKQGIISNISKPIIQINDLAGQIQNLIRIPSITSDNIENTLILYRNFTNDVLGSHLSGEGGEAEVRDDMEKNEALVIEISSVAAFTIMNDVIIEGSLTTRKETIEISDNIIDDFNNMIDGLDRYQAHFDTELADVQYFTQSESYNDCIKMLAQTLRYLIISSFDLKIEKKFVLKEPKSAIGVTIEQYGELGNNDENLDFFINSNNLEGQDIMLMPAGKELVIYI